MWRGFWNDPDGLSLKDIISISVLLVTCWSFVYMVLTANDNLTDSQIRLFDIFMTLPIIIVTGYFIQEGIPIASNIILRSRSKDSYKNRGRDKDFGIGSVDGTVESNTSSYGESSSKAMLNDIVDGLESVNQETYNKLKENK